ncbi:MAG: dienelactone hydrolase family protein [Actinomycetota bacterium]
MRLRRVLVSLFVLAVVAAACGGDDDTADTDAANIEADAAADDGAVSGEADVDESPTTTSPPQTTTTTTTEPPLPAIEPIGDGPYAVGVQTITVAADHRDFDLTVDVWFPLVEGATGDAARYAFVTGDYYDSPRALAVGLDQASDAGPFPMVVYSHGSGGIRFIHSDYTETIASHGYVVVAPDHAGNTAVERVLGNADPFDLISYNRPLDVISVIDGVLANGAVAPLIDAESIAVTGHSFGGFTSYAVASGADNPIGATPADPRVDALIPLAPALALLTEDDLARIDIPTLILVGTDDTTTPVEPNVETPWAVSPASPHYRVELVAGEHQSFTDLCDYLEVVPDREGANPLVVDVITDMGVEGCSADDMPIERVKELTNTFAVTFLESVFRGGEMITDETNSIPDDVIYDDK